MNFFEKLIYFNAGIFFSIIIVMIAIGNNATLSSNTRMAIGIISAVGLAVTFSDVKRGKQE